MKENKSPGVDGISPKILKETVEQISTPLAHVFNMSLKEGIVPFEWKEANIIPLFKKGSRNKSVNYRPVSLTSVICKLLETIIRDHMMDFLIKHKLINPSQHGFLKAKSCLTNLLCFLEEITKWVDSSSFVSFTQCSPTCGRMPLPSLSLWPGRQPCRPRLVGDRRGGGPSSVAPRSRNPPTGHRRDSPISSSLFSHGQPLCAVG